MRALHDAVVTASLVSFVHFFFIFDFCFLDTENVPEHEPVILREPEPTTFTREPTIPDSTAHLSHPVAG